MGNLERRVEKLEQAHGGVDPDKLYPVDGIVRVMRRLTAEAEAEGEDLSAEELAERAGAELRRQFGY